MGWAKGRADRQEMSRSRLLVGWGTGLSFRGSLEGPSPDLSEGPTELQLP